MREDIAKTSSNFGCRPPRCAESVPRAGGLLLPGPARPRIPTPSTTGKGRAWRQCQERDNAVLPSYGEMNRSETLEKYKCWVREASAWSLLGTATRYHRLRLMAVLSQTPAVVKWEQHSARGSAAALHPWSISIGAQRVCSGPHNAARPQTHRTPQVTHVEGAVPGPALHQVSAGEVRGITAQQRLHRWWSRSYSE